MTRWEFVSHDAESYTVHVTVENVWVCAVKARDADRWAVFLIDARGVVHQLPVFDDAERARVAFNMLYEGVK